MSMKNSLDPEERTNNILKANIVIPCMNLKKIQ